MTFDVIEIKNKIKNKEKIILSIQISFIRKNYT